MDATPSAPPAVSLGHIHLNDLVALLFALIAIYISLQHHSDKQFALSLLVPFDAASSYRDEHAPSADELVPAPLVVDLQARGANEVVMALRGSSPELRLYARSRDASHSYSRRPSGAVLIVKRSLLPPHTSISSGRQPLLLRNGFVHPYKEDGVYNRRKQVLVVVTDALHVLCYDSDLNLLWETSVSDDTDVHAVAELAVLITSKPMRRGDTGAVIVGARLQRRQRDVDGSEKLHFSYYAFDGATGHLRWKHEAGDFAPATAPSQILRPQHEVHAEEAHWSKFRNDMLDALPHQWSERSHTRFELARFDRNHRVRHGQVHQHQPHGHDDAHHEVGLLFGGLSPHDASEHVQKPNVLVAHVADGIEAIHLYSGHPVCTLSLQQGVLHTDFDGDAVVDHIQSVAGSHSPFSHGRRVLPTHLPRCLALITSGIPQNAQLLNGSICKHDFRSSLLHNLEDHDAPLDVALPTMIQSESGDNIAIFLNSDGTVSALALKDSLRWQMSTSSSWNLDEDDSDASVALRKRAFRPSITPMSLQPFGAEDHLLAIGESVATLLYQDGSILHEFPLDDIPVMAPTIADFNSDGWNDILITTPSGLFGYEMHRHLGLHLFNVLLGFLVLLLTIIFVLHLLKKRPAVIISLLLPNSSDNSSEARPLYSSI